MGTGKTYSTKYLLDSNNNSGVAGQVLSTTSTGIDWADANTLPGAGLWLESGNNIYNSNSGNVGIGVTGPTAKLDVRGSAVFRGSYLGATIAPTATGVDMYFYEGNNPKIYLQSAGPSAFLMDVGIGVASPQRQLHVNSGTTNVVARFESTDGYSVVEFKDPSGTAEIGNIGNDLILLPAGAEKMRILANGNVGIGTTAPLHDLQIGNAGTNGSYSMMIEGNFANTALSSNPRLNLIDTNFGITAGKYGSGGSDDAIGIFAYQGAGRGILFAHTTAGSGTTLQNMRHDMFVDGGTGNVGIGTTNPIGYRLVVENTSEDLLKLHNSTDGLDSLISFTNPGGTLARIQGIDNGGLGFDVGNNAGGIISNAMFVKNNGNVGIGTTSPNDKLDVTDGNSKMVFGGASSDRPLLYFQHNAVPVDGEEIGLFDFRGYNSASQDTRYVIWTAKAEDVTDGTEDGSLTLQTMKDGTATTTFTGRSGKVGIANANPAQALDVTGKIRVTDDIILAQQNGRIDYDNGVSTGALRFFSTSGNTERMRITSAGNVGIGLTGPLGRLHLSDDDGPTSLYITNLDTAQTDAGDVQNTIIMKGLYWSGSATSQLVETRINSVHQIADGNGGSALTFMTQTGGSGVVEQMRIDRDGNVGIGTDNPTTKLYVDGGESTFNRGNSAGTIATFRGQNAAKAVIGTATSYFTSNVGIGTTTVQNKLVVRGSGSAFNSTLQNSTASIISKELTDNAYHSILQLVAVRQSLTTGKDSQGYLGFSTVDDSNNQGQLDAGRIAIVNETGSSRNSATALTFWTNPGGTQTTAAVEKMRISSGGLVKFNAYGAGTLVTDASGNITASSGGGAGGPFLPLAGGTMTGDINMENGERIRWTDNPSGGLSIHSNSSNSFIQHTGTGYFQISNDCTGGIQTEMLLTNFARNQAVRFQADNGNPEGTTSCEVRDYFFLDGASATYASGASTAVYTVFPDLSYIALGTGKDLQLHHDGNHSYIKDTGTGDLKISSNTVRIESNNAENMIIASANGSVNLYYNNSSRLATTFAGVDLTGSVSINNPSNNESILNIQDDGTNGHIAFENSSEVTGIITSGTDFINFRTGDGVSMSDSPVLTLFPNRIGINTTSPNSNVALEVDGRVLIKDSTGVADLYLGNYATANYFRFHTNNSNTYFDAECGLVYWRYNGGAKMTFDVANGNMSIDGTLTQNSDIRLKENIVEIGDCISKVKAMRGVYYNRNDKNTEVTKVGVIAQDVEAVLPELIIESPEDGLKSVAYSELTAVLINAIKEQQEIIEDLKTRITKLEN